MKTTLTIQLRAFPVKIWDLVEEREMEDVLVLDKQQLQAAQLVGQSSKELINRLYDRQGYKVLEIGKAEKREISLNLEELYRMHKGAVRLGE